MRCLRPGESAGYALAFQAQRPTRLAVAAIGYGDGLPRTLPQLGAEALLHGRRVKMVGRMCMDQLLLDVTDLENVQPGDMITLIGRDGGSAITAVELAERCQTLPNEVLSQLSAARLGLITQT